MLMQSKLSVSDEEVIRQYDESKTLFIILSGTVNIYININNEAEKKALVSSFMTNFMHKSQLTRIKELKVKENQEKIESKNS